ncbi:hypothetical protein OKW21_005824 [Catalinimonas alkaloidigena]|uniref:hypothetical protein n=1 Tax=Catalinimonas alkaloidigena TaxID=1075417 RepID=UPI0024071FA9|nr:hypothetical protein [Catalinimonas alkaloidigena]MDF9800561.1 hypothetical protein [Catalinimonas alkaloidigena]
MAYFKIQHEVLTGNEGEWRLCFQWGTYTYEDSSSEKGYRFIWRRPDGSLQPARGQARIPSANDIFHLFHLATKEGWFVNVENKE